jgi:hypothetical protein
MAFVPKPNTGTLWPNNKMSPNQPDVRGDLHLDADMVRKLVRASEDGMIHISVSGWNKTIVGKQCISIAASEPYVKKDKVDEEVPF